MTEPTTAEKLAALVRDFLDPDPCSLDHHGYCQAHGWLCEGPCPHGRAREVLAEYDAPAAVPPADRAALRDRVADIVQPLLMDTLPKVIARARGYEISDAVLSLLPASSTDLIEEYLRFLRSQGPEPDLSDLTEEQRAAATGQFEIVRALADRDPALPPLDQDPVAHRLGLLPAPVDRAAVLREAADWLKAWRPEFFERWAVAEQERYEGGVDDAAAELRRLAAEATPQHAPEPVPCVRHDPHPGHLHSGLRRGVAVHGRCPGVPAAVVEPQPDTTQDGDRIVGYRSNGGRLLRCLAHHPGQRALDVGDFHPVTSEDLSDGGNCTYPTSHGSLSLQCGVDVLIPQEADPVRLVHVGGNAEDCPACHGTNPPYPFICPGPDASVEEARHCPAKHGALGRICELRPGHDGMHTGTGPNGSAVWGGDAP